MRNDQKRPAELLQQAATLSSQGRLPEAEVLYRTVLASDGKDFDGLSQLGTLLYRQRRYADALRTLRAALGVKSNDVEVLSTIGLVESALGHSDEALQSYDKALGLRPDDANLLNNRGVALADAKRHEEALADYDQALTLEPGHVMALNNRGNALRELDRPIDALASFEHALAIQPDFPEVFRNRALALDKLGRAEEALASFDRAVALKPDYSEALESKAVLLADLGRIDEACETVTAAIDLDPRRVRGYFLLSDFRRLPLDNPYVRSMEEIATDMKSLSVAEQIDLNFSLGKVWADNADHARAFPRLLEANALKREQTDYDEATTLKAMTDMPAVFTEELMRAGAGLGDPNSMPIFIVGMPRSGTSLIEQILASHPDVFGAGETYAFSKALSDLRPSDDDPEVSPEEAWGRRMRQLGENYLNRISVGAPKVARIADKTLENFRVIGLIRLALPNARIIHARRDPLDTCISCFSRQFVDLPYTYDLAELGRHYRTYQSLMGHWRAVAPEDALIEVDYEQVVDDLEGQARRIVAHCGLEWDPRCLDFHLTERPVRTASNTQVRQPIYRSSVGRWQAYQSFLGPLINALGLADDTPRGETALGPTVR